MSEPEIKVLFVNQPDRPVAGCKVMSVDDPTVTGAGVSVEARLRGMVMSVHAPADATEAQIAALAARLKGDLAGARYETRVVEPPSGRGPGRPHGPRRGG